MINIKVPTKIDISKKIVSTTVIESARKEIVEIALENGISISNVVRQLIYAGLDRNLLTGQKNDN